MSKKFIVDEDYQDARFDKWFKNKVISLPQSLLEKIIRLNKVKVNNKKTKSSYRVQEGDEVEIYELSNLKSQKILKPLKYIPKTREINDHENYIIEDNDNFVIVNKPAGLPVQGGTKSFKNMLDILRKSKYFLNTKPYIVHRIDKDTSGILIVAKNRKFAQLFTSLFRIRKIYKTYVAITHGQVSKSINVLRDNLIYFEKNKKLTQKAITYLKVLKSQENYSLLELNPITGRKHQLRKQLLNIGNPIVGDKKYFLSSLRKSKNKHLMLHAQKIKFMINNVQYTFKANYNSDFKDHLKKKF